jgi:hypothetical protein
MAGVCSWGTSKLGEHARRGIPGDPDEKHAVFDAGSGRTLSSSS